MNEQKRIEIAIHRSGPEPGEIFDQLDFGPLLDSLTEQPNFLSGIAEGGSLNIEIARTREWELVLGILVIGSTVFAQAIASKVAERMVDWSVKQAQKLRTRGSPQVSSPGGGKVIVDAANPTPSVVGIETLLREAAERKLRVTLTIEPVE